MIAKSVCFTKDHVWLTMDGDEATVGITDHAQKSLGDITFVDLPRVGKVVKAQDSLVVVESVKAASDVYAPVAGKVSAVNETLMATPELINQSAYGEGWICKLKPFETAAAGRLLTADQYKVFLADAR
jgi:glycine cleavage system H protein